MFDSLCLRLIDNLPLPQSNQTRKLTQTKKQIRLTSENNPLKTKCCYSRYVMGLKKSKSQFVLCGIIVGFFFSAFGEEVFTTPVIVMSRDAMS